MFQCSGFHPLSDRGSVNSFFIRRMPGTIDASAWHRAAARRLRNTVLVDSKYEYIYVWKQQIVYSFCRLFRTCVKYLVALPLVSWIQADGIDRSVLGLAGRPWFDSRQEQEIFPFSTVSLSALGLTQPPVQWVRGDKATGTWSWPLTSI
jgi:hypothetical protein